MIRAFLNWPKLPLALTEVAGRRGGLLDRSVGTERREAIVPSFRRPLQLRASGHGLGPVDPERGVVPPVPATATAPAGGSRTARPDAPSPRSLSPAGTSSLGAHPARRPGPLPLPPPPHLPAGPQRSRHRRLRRPRSRTGSPALRRPQPRQSSRRSRGQCAEPGEEASPLPRRAATLLPAIPPRPPPPTSSGHPAARRPRRQVRAGRQRMPTMPASRPHPDVWGYPPAAVGVGSLARTTRIGPTVLKRLVCEHPRSHRSSPGRPTPPRVRARLRGGG